MSRVTREIDGEKYTYFRTYYELVEATRRKDQIETYGRKVHIEARPVQRGTAFDVMVQATVGDRLCLGFLDMLSEFLYPPWRVPYAQQPRVDEMILK